MKIKLLSAIFLMAFCSFSKAVIIEKDAIIYSNTVTYATGVVYRAGVTGLVSVSAPTGDFTNMTVGGESLTSTNIANYNITTNWVSRNSNYLSTARFIVTTNIVFNNTASTNYIIPFVMNGCDIINGKIFFANTNNLTNTTGNIGYAKTIITTIYDASNFAPYNRLAQYSFDLSCVTNMFATTIGASSTNIIVTDNSNVMTNDMLFISGTDVANTNEYAVILALGGTTNIIFETALTNSHAANSAIMEVKEFGGVNIYDEGGTTNTYWNFKVTNAITATLTLILEYTK